MDLTPIEQKIESLIAPIIEESGLRLVCARIVNEGHGTVLRVMAEDPATRNLDIDKCAELSREISALLDVEDVIDSRYYLEVSSPGMDRPLVREEDYTDYEGFEAKIEIDPPVDGQKKFRGRIRGMENNEIILDTDQGRLALPYSSVHKAKLVMTDELLNRYKQKKA
ncbi:MAG: ribosome maturation factor RimP [Rhodospirillales bacterium]|nr:ribosome maturation factor RimP [Rhodospirillales bacterium]